MQGKKIVTVIAQNGDREHHCIGQNVPETTGEISGRFQILPISVDLSFGISCIEVSTLEKWSNAISCTPHIFCCNMIMYNAANLRRCPTGHDQLYKETQ